VGATGVDLGPGAIAAAALGVALAAALWWLYFDDATSAAERGLHGAPRGRAQNTMARDSYSFGHLPMVVGIVLLALGAKKTLAHVGDPLRLVGPVALAGGVALYLLAHVAFRRRTVGTIAAPRLAAAALCVLFVPVAAQIPALAALATVTLICAAMVAYEAVRPRDARPRPRPVPTS